MNEDMRVMPITLFRCIYCSLWTDFTHYYSVSVINCEQRMQTLFMQWHQPIFHALCLPTVGRLLPRVYWHFRQIYRLCEKMLFQKIQQFAKYFLLNHK